MYRHAGRIAAAILVWLVSLVWIGSLLPRLGVGSPTLFFILAIVNGIAIGSILIVRCFQRPGDNAGSLRGRGKHLRVGTTPRRRSVLERIVPYLSALVGLPWIVVPGIRSGGAPEFLMRNDMVWNTGQSMMIHLDGGVAPLINPAPMTNLLYAFAYGPSSTPGLRNIFIAHLVVLIVLVLLASVVPAVHVARTMEQAPLIYRVILPMAIGWFPFTAPILGRSIDLGHANVLLVYLVIVCTWIAFVEFRNPALRAAILGCASTVTLATWGPLVIVPLSLGVASLPSLWEQRPRRAGIQPPSKSRFPYLLMLASVLQMVVYGVFITLPDLRVSGKALGGTGGASITLGDMALVFAFYVGLLIMYRRSVKDYKDRRRLSGAAILTLISSIGVVTILTLEVYRRNGVFYGYYQMKFAAILFAVLTAIAVTLVAQIVSMERRSWMRFGALTVVLALMVSSVFLGRGYWSPRENGEDVTLYGLLSAAHPMFKYRHDEREQRVEDLIAAFDASYPNRGLFLYRYANDETLPPNLSNTEADTYVNRYMIQLSTIHDEKNRYDIRTHAYNSTTTSPEWVCNLIELWGDEQPITVFTSPEYYDRAVHAVSQCSTSVTVTTDLTGN